MTFTLQDEAVAESAEAIFTADVLKQLENANWKERLAGMERITEVGAWIIAAFKTESQWLDDDLKIYCYS